MTIMINDSARYAAAVPCRTPALPVRMKERLEDAGAKLREVFT
jgi:hypothetical protein